MATTAAAVSVRRHGKARRSSARVYRDERVDAEERQTPGGSNATGFAGTLSRPTRGFAPLRGPAITALGAGALAVNFSRQAKA
jgi:hypothetical protein